MTKSMVRFAWLAAFLASAVLASGARADDIETDHLFAFNSGTDIGNPGEKEVSATFNGRYGRNGGFYAAVESELSFQYTATRNLAFTLAAATDYHKIKDVPDFDDRNAAAFGGLSLQVNYRLLEREKSGVGLGISAEPRWSRVDDDSGEPITGYGSEFVLAADVEVVPNFLVGVLNVSYEPESSQSRVDDTWSQQNTLGFGGGLMLKLRDNVFAGVEGRYLRRYDSLGFSDFTGQAFYLGPTVSIALSEQAWVTVGWNMQIAGRAADGDGALDLVNFDRHQAVLTFGASF
jgi:opacity protein-like surface antigen